MSARFYRFAYATGFKPWEDVDDAYAAQVSSLLAREEAGQQQPFGWALDLGCGTGRWSIDLARRGWDVVGIDLVPKAVRAARERAQEADVEVRFIEGDVTNLLAAGLPSGVRLVLDMECFNHLSDEQRTAYGDGVNAVAGPDASLLLLVWQRARRGPMPPGASQEDVERAFPGWGVDDEEPYAAALPRPLRSTRPRWYRLSRR
jgi:SAM-dependent methyltransferase